MELTLLGTGCPSVDLDRYGPAALVDAGPGARLLIDCGSGVTQRLLGAGCPGRMVDAVLLTHLHSDHIIDLFQLLVSSWHQGRDRPQRLFGPPGTRAYVDGLLGLWAAELKQRIAHENRPSTAGLEIEVTEISGGQRRQFGDLTVTAIEVDHRPVRHAFGFIFEGGGERLAISGDTTYCPALIEAARGVDMLLHEVFIHREMPVIEGVRTARTVANVAAYHTMSDTVGRVAREAGAGSLVLTHFVPPRFDHDALLAEVRQSFDGPVIIGHDLMKLNVGERCVSGDRSDRPPAAPENSLKRVPAIPE